MVQFYDHNPSRYNMAHKSRVELVELVLPLLAVLLSSLIAAHAQGSGGQTTYNIETQHQPDDPAAKEEYYSPALLVVESDPVTTYACVDWSPARFCFDVDPRAPQVRITVYVYGYLVLDTNLNPQNACAALQSPTIPGVKLEGKLCANFDGKEVSGSINLCVFGVCKGLDGVLFRWGAGASEPGVPVTPKIRGSFKFCNKDYAPEASFQVWWGASRINEITLRANDTSSCGEVQTGKVWYDIYVWTKKDGGIFLAQKTYQYADGRGWTLVKNGNFYDLRDGVNMLAPPSADMSCACTNWQCTKACPEPGKPCVGHKACAPITF